MLRPSPLRRLRLCLGLRLHDVERATRIPSSAVSRCERGEAALNAPRLERFAAFFGVRPDDLARAMEVWAARHAPRPLEHVEPPRHPLDEASDLGPEST
jgi:transcriptional regulator with XRE-family HTH domain